MKQINNNFAEYYYLTRQGEVIDIRTNKIIKPHQYKYRLKTVDNERKSINLKPLYKLVYNENFCIDNIEDLQGEEWREVEDTQGLYYVSSYGRIKSLYNYEAIILNPTINKKGYARVDIYCNGVRSSKLLHVLVAAAFLDKPKDLLQQIHHKDFDKLNSCANNLCYLSVSEHKKIHRERRIKENGN